MLDKLKQILGDKRIALLGFGLEGQSSFRFFSKHFPEHHFLIADQNTELQNHTLLQGENISFSLGKSYLDQVSIKDFIIKSPGIKIPTTLNIAPNRIYSQTELFIQSFSKQIIGITGTKGKSTTASLLFEILKDQHKKALLIGNIGKPALDYWDKIEKETWIVFELSAHQLEYTRSSPSYSILLNLFPEHLDYFNTKEDYYLAKLNITKFQSDKDFFFSNTEILKNLPSNFLAKSVYSSRYDFKENSLYRKLDGKSIISLTDLLHLKGAHQLKNCIPLLDLSLVLGLSEELTVKSILKFKPLPHRIEYIGRINKMHFYNDSISTIPEACIEALKALKSVDYLILGGLDRGLDYQKLYSYLRNTSLSKVYFMGPAGNRMFQELSEDTPFEKIYLATLDQFGSHLESLIKQTKTSLCLLSPAAASYNEFKNFEARGHYFSSLISKYPDFTSI